MAISLLKIVKHIKTLEGGVELYIDADVEVRDFNPNDVLPTQKYVIRSHVERVRELYEKYLPQGVDLFKLDDLTNLDGITIAPPLTEWSEEDQKPIIVDGTHRIWLAREMKKSITCVYVKGVRPDLPVYALPVPWEEVKVYEEPPQDPKLRRIYRIPPENGDTLFKKYFRDLSVLGSGGKRPRKGEEHLMPLES